MKENKYNPTKKDKIKNDKTKEMNSKKKETTLYLFYMTQNDIESRQIYELFRDSNEIVIELWDAMNILQLELPNKNTTEFELIEPDFKDPFDQSFIKNRNIKTIFTVTTKSEDFEMLKPIFKRIMEKYEGFFCADSDDFKPLYKSENL